MKQRKISASTGLPTKATPAMVAAAGAATAEVLARMDLAVDVKKVVPLLELTESSCRWPIGDPRSPDFGYCGDRKVVGISYCAAHARIAHLPPRRP